MLAFWLSESGRFAGLKGIHGPTDLSCQTKTRKTGSKCAASWSFQAWPSESLGPLHPFHSQKLPDTRCQGHKFQWLVLPSEMLVSLHENVLNTYQVGIEPNSYIPIEPLKQLSLGYHLVGINKSKYM